MAGSIKATYYTNFKGVDFSTDASLVSKNRSPLATNIIADVGGVPEKRPGWRTLHNFATEGETPEVHGLWSGVIGGETHFLAHVGTRLYRWTETERTLLMEGLSDSPGACAYFGGKLWLTVGKYVVYDGETVKPVSESGYIPTTTIARSPAGGGVTYEDVNLASPWRKNSFCSDGEATEYQLDAEELDLKLIVKQTMSAGVRYGMPYALEQGRTTQVQYGFEVSAEVPVGAVICYDWSKSTVEVNGEVLNYADGPESATKGIAALSDYAAVEESCAVTVMVDEAAKVQGTDFIVDYGAGLVKFVTAPGKPAVTGTDNVTVQFARTAPGYQDKIDHCSIIAAFGVGSNDRLVFSGNPEYPNQDWTSGLNDPSYIPDLSYATVGLEGIPIMGYARVGENLAIIKSDNGQDSTVFMRTASLDEDGQAVFTLKQALAGVGAVSKKSFASLLDEPLFLSGTGIFALTSNVITNERICQNRSFYVNSALTAEPGLEDACAVAYKGMYFLGVGKHVYILDARQEKTYRSETLGDYVYECYYWENVPVVCWMNYKDGADEHLYFGTADGRICRFNTDINGVSKYNDDGEVIQAVWATKADDDGDPTVYKTMIKKGGAVTLKPYSRSSARICFRSDKDTVDWMGAYGTREVYGTMDIFDWLDIDFSRFTFNSNDAPQEIMFNSKVKKYKRLQILIRNNGLNEGFGVYGITKHYVTGNFAKR